MNAVEFRELSKVYKTRRESREALRGLTLDIPQGQIFGFAGPNGAGKSTSIKILVGLVHATSGSVSVFGHAAGTRQAREMLGFLPEVTLYHEFMGAQELLEIHAHLAGLPRSEHRSRIQEVLETVGLSDRGGSRISEFSKGMKQRFGIAQAILGRPKLLVLDELTSGLDPQAQANLLQLLSGLKQQGMTIFFSSHHLVEIEKVCDSVAIVHRGTLRASGSLNELLGDGGRTSITIRPLAGATLDAIQWRIHPDGMASCSVPREESGPLLDSLRAQGHEVVELRSERQSLEALFHRLTPETEEVAA
jgi:ABC-2 type transport system ATP-binding protein